MPTDFLDTEPRAYFGTSPAGAVTPVAFVPRSLSVEFTGSGSEYFRIWLVNLLLIIVTLGLYFPWAKVRRLRYFYGNTLIDGEPLGFHGDAWKMFKGFAIMAVFFGLYSVAGNISPAAGFVAFLVIAGLWPALFKASMQFRMANTSWRGLRFGFSGSTRDAYRACLPLFIPGVLILGLMVIAPELQNQDAAHRPSTQWTAVFGVVMLLTLVITPWLLWNLKSYQHRHYHFSSETSQFTVKPKSYYGLTLKVIGVLLLAYALLIGAIVVGVMGFASLASSNFSKGPMVGILMGIAGVFVAVLSFSAIKPYAVARFQNLVWNGTRSQHLQFQSALRVRSMVWLTLKNWLLILLTLGLYWPFAAVAMTRLRLTAVEVTSSIDPAELLASAHRGEGQTLGEASGDFLGFEIGL